MPSIGSFLVIIAIAAGLFLLVLVPIWAMIKATELRQDRWATGIALAINVPPISLLLAMVFLAKAPTPILHTGPTPGTTERIRTPRDPATADDAASPIMMERIVTWASAAIVLIVAGIAYALRG